MEIIIGSNFTEFNYDPTKVLGFLSGSKIFMIILGPYIHYMWNNALIGNNDFKYNYGVGGTDLGAFQLIFYGLL